MATTKSRTTRRPARSTTASRSSTSTSSASRKSTIARAGKAISDRPVASAAIGTGLVAGIAAGIAGFLAFKKSGKSFGQFSDDVATNLKEKASDARTFVKDGIADAKTKAQDFTDRRKDGFETDANVEKSQSEIAEEALTLKETGMKTKGKRPVDPVIEEQSKVGAISY